MEVTFDPGAGDAFVSRNGQALDNQEPASSEEELVLEPSDMPEVTEFAAKNLRRSCGKHTVCQKWQSLCGKHTGRR